MQWMRTIAAAAALTMLWQADAHAAGCNDTCLNRHLDRYLTQLLKHDPAPLPLAANVLSIENAKAVKPGEGSWQTITSLPPGQRFVDASIGEAVYMGATMDQAGKIGSLFVRLKIVDGRIAESELFTKGAYTGAMDQGSLLEPDILYDAIVPPGRRSTRAALVKVVDLYMDGISEHKGSLFPASPRCDRYQAGARFTSNFDRPESMGGGTCQSSMNNLKGQAVVNRRFSVVDVERGIVAVMFVIPHEERTPPNATNVAEVFKIVDGKVRSIEEFSFGGAWPPSSGFPDRQ